MIYPELEKRVAKTYAARSTATLKNSLYDTYKMAIRWASDRIGEQGVIALVTNGSWIDGNADSGVRACLAEEFSSIYVLNLRGNARTSGELRRSEGDNAFGQGSRAPVAITILVRNPEASHDGCRILYRDIGDYLRREEKLAVLREGGRSLASRIGRRSRPTGITTGSASEARNSKSSIRWGRRPQRLAKRMRRSSRFTATATRPAKMRIYTTSRAMPVRRMPARW